MESSKPQEKAPASTVQAQPEEEKKQSRKRYDHLRMIEKKMQEVQRAINEGEANAIEGHEQLDFEVKNSGKYMTTFPYPYMNGYLHLGKFILTTTSTYLKARCVEFNYVAALY